MPSRTSQWLADYERKRNKDHSGWIEGRFGKPVASAGGEAPTAQPERPVCHEPLATAEGKESHPKRVLVRVTAFRQRLLDPDNCCAKYFVDCCRYAGLIPNDRAEDIEYSVSQVKVKTKAEEETVITIERL